MQETSCRCGATSYRCGAQVLYKLTEVFLSATARHTRTSNFIRLHWILSLGSIVTIVCISNQSCETFRWASWCVWWLSFGHKITMLLHVTFLVSEQYRRLKFRGLWCQWRQRQTSCHWKRSQFSVTKTQVERWNLVTKLSSRLTQINRHGPKTLLSALRHLFC